MHKTNTNPAKMNESKAYRASVQFPVIACTRLQGFAKKRTL